MHPPKRTEEIANRCPNAFNRVGVDFSDPIRISISCPLSFPVANCGMTPIESRITAPLIRIYSGSQLGELMHMRKQRLFIGLMHDPQSDLTRLASYGAYNRWSVFGIGATTPAFIRTATRRV